MFLCQKTKKGSRPVNPNGYCCISPKFFIYLTLQYTTFIPNTWWEKKRFGLAWIWMWTLKTQMISLRPSAHPPHMQQTFDTLESLRGKRSSQTPYIEDRFIGEIIPSVVLMSIYHEIHSWCFFFDHIRWLLEHVDLIVWSRYPKKHAKFISHMRQPFRAWWSGIQCLL